MPGKDDRAAVQCVADRTGMFDMIDAICAAPRKVETGEFAGQWISHCPMWEADSIAAQVPVSLLSVHVPFNLNPVNSNLEDLNPVNLNSVNSNPVNLKPDIPYR